MTSEALLFIEKAKESLAAGRSHDQGMTTAAICDSISPLAIRVFTYSLNRVWIA